MACPPMHTAYQSEMLARNMVVLHSISRGCTALETFRCDDHWHVGHKTRWAGERCKAGNKLRLAHLWRDHQKSS